MYTSGINPKIERLYPKVTFPVSRGTPTICDFPLWDHNVQWKTSLSIASQVSDIHT